ncbi:chromate transporter (plasmid) [Sphingopyxis macrogoltabida]|nr:chromate transporter [Sphingopyxis macrogoltabida]
MIHPSLQAHVYDRPPHPLCHGVPARRGDKHDRDPDRHLTRQGRIFASRSWHRHRRRPGRCSGGVAPCDPSAGAAIVHDRDAALGEGLPDHARPNLSWSLRISGILLVLWLAPVAALLLALGADDVFSRIATFFSQMAVVTFGGAYAVLAYVAQEAVETYGWLQPGEMLDGLGMAETTPGPLIMVTQFVGFLAAFREATGLPPLLAATLGAILTTWVTFLPCFLWIFAGAPFIERLRGNRALSAALSAITAAVVGVILNLAVWFGIHTLFEQVRKVPFAAGAIDLPVRTSVDWPALALAVSAILAMFRFKAGMLPVLGVCSVLGAAYVMII